MKSSADDSALVARLRPSRERPRVILCVAFCFAVQAVVAVPWRHRIIEHRRVIMPGACIKTASREAASALTAYAEARLSASAPLSTNLACAIEARAS